MNGLKFIRSFCYMSTNALAEKLGVSRSAITLWENGQKEIPEKRAEEIAEIFGVEKEWIYEIPEEKIIEIKEYANQRYYVKGEDYYRLSPNESTDKIGCGILDLEEVDSFHREAEYKKELNEFIDVIRKNFALEDGLFGKMIDLEIKEGRLKKMRSVLEILAKTQPDALAQNYATSIAIDALCKLFEVDYNIIGKKFEAKAEIIADAIKDNTVDLVENSEKFSNRYTLESLPEDKREDKLKELVDEKMKKLSSKYKMSH